MRRAGAVLALFVATACATSAPARARDRVAIVDAARVADAGVDLTGTWATGSSGEPAAARLVLRLECNRSPAMWALEQRADTVRLWVLPASRAQGIATRHPASTTPVEGRLHGVELTMGGEGARYLLRYDSTSGHLRGTLNGTPFWAVRQQLVRPEHCIAIP